MSAGGLRCGLDDHLYGGSPRDEKLGLASRQQPTGRRKSMDPAIVSAISALLRSAIMIFGMSMSTFVTVHVILSLIGIASGLVALLGMIGGRRLDVWVA